MASKLITNLLKKFGGAKNGYGPEFFFYLRDDDGEIKSEYLAADLSS